MEVKTHKLLPVVQSQMMKKTTGVLWNRDNPRFGIFGSSFLIFFFINEIQIKIFLRNELSNPQYSDLSGAKKKILNLLC